MAKPNCFENFLRKKSVGKTPNMLFKMLFEGNEACSWHTEAGSGAMAEQHACSQLGFFFAYISL